MTGRTITLPSVEGGLPLYDAQPVGPARGAVVVLQEGFGVNAHIEDVASRFASEGYHAVAPHLFFRTGDPVISYDDIPSVLPHMAALTVSDLAADLDTTLHFLQEAGHSPNRIAPVGFCMGGTVALFAATRKPMGAAVSFYGGGVGKGRFGLPPLIDLAPQLTSPWLGLYGDTDDGIPVHDVEALRRAAACAPVTTEVIRYTEAGHGFHCDMRSSYHEPSARHAWARTLGWLDRHVRG